MKLLFSSRYSIHQIGEAAHRLLTTGQRGKILAVFSNSAYLLTEQKELFWLGAETTPLHPRSLQISGSFPTLITGASFIVDNNGISIDPSVRLGFNQAHIWHTPLLADNEVLQIAEIPGRIKTIISTFLDLSQPKGFGKFLPAILALFVEQDSYEEPPGNLFRKQIEDCDVKIAPLYILKDNPGDVQRGQPIASMAWPTIHKIAKSCLVRDLTHLKQMTGDLVGLGEGLTPSGDDFMGGLLFCIFHLRRIYPVFSDILDTSEYIEQLKNSTNLISFTILKDLAYGLGVYPLHQLFASILTNQPLENSILQISRVIQIGHSTGWDLLTGLFTGLLLTVGHATNRNGLTDSIPLPIEHNNQSIITERWGALTSPPLLR